MNTSEKGLNLIKAYEGCRLTSYKCPGGVWTIGYGHTSGVTEGMTITQQQADKYLKDDIQRFEGYVTSYAKKYGYELNQDQFDALVSFTYNAGPGNLDRYLLLKGERTIEQVKLYLPTVCIKAKNQILPGLVRRRVAEANLMGDCRRDIDVVAKEVIAGKWGNGQAREHQLKECGYNYQEVQSMVAKLLRKEEQ